MYQQYVNEARAAQYQQQCRQEAATERGLRVSRPRQPPDAPPARSAARPAGVVTWLRTLWRQRAVGLR